jgi:hypothetical protein
MFNPTQHDVRRFFCETYRKSVERTILTPLESIAADWISQHPEYAATLADLDSALEADYVVDQGKTNPFLHLSMHLSIAEQISINQPVGIHTAFLQLARLKQSEHEAHHAMMECLGAMIWESQRNGLPFDGVAYVAAVNALANKLIRI